MNSNRIGTAMAAAALCAASVLSIAGCNTAPPPQETFDYSVTLNKYYEGRPMCLWQEMVKFPIENATPETIDQLGLVALTDAGLLVGQPATGPAPKRVTSFDLSPEGRSALDPDVFNPGAGNFCYGRRKVVSIDGVRRNSSTTELVNYHYGVAQPASWAQEVTIQSAFPQVATELAGEHIGQATLLDTTGGWEISGTPATLIPPLAKPKPRGPSELAKATTLLHLRKRPEISQR
jgi:hypothetical protein